jgi:hypothetical protein
VNFLFWSGLAQAGVIFSAILQVTTARWGRPLKRLAEASSAFMPVSLVTLVLVLAAHSHLFPWIDEPIPARQAWLNVPFLASRQILALVVLQGLSLLHVYWSVRPDLGLVQRSGGDALPALARRLTNGWRGLDEERTLSQSRQRRLAPAILITYAVVFTLQAFDFVMSLDRHFYSTLLGGFFFIGNLYLGLASLAILAVWIRPRLGLNDYITPDQFHDLGKLLLAFCMLWTYMFFSQYLVIWYGNLPEELMFVIHRVEPPWLALAWVVLGACFFIPFVVLLSRGVKRRPNALMAVSIVIAIGMWLERFILVVPSLWKDHTLPLGVIEILMTAGFLGIFVLCYVKFLSTVPVLPVADPLLVPAVGTQRNEGSES